LSELARIRQEYARRQARLANKNRTASLYALFVNQQLERSISGVLESSGCDLPALQTLDVGCGNGFQLRNLVRYGANPENLHGIDLLWERIQCAYHLSPNITFYCGNAENLPFADASFDMVMQFTVFSSILDQGMRQKIAAEMLRVLKNAGWILWWDFWVSNPHNPHTRGIGRAEIMQLFPNCVYIFHRVTLAPPIVRRLIGHSWLLCYLLECIPFLRTHYLAVIRKQVAGG